MHGYMNIKAELSIETKEAHYWSGEKQFGEGGNRGLKQRSKRLRSMMIKTVSFSK